MRSRRRSRARRRRGKKPHAASNQAEARLALPRGYPPGVADDELRAVYSEALIERIAAKFKIPTEARADLKETALQAGAFYKQINLIADKRPKLAEIRAFFEFIEYHASSLLRALEQADDDSWAFYMKLEQDIQTECVFQKLSTAMQDIGAAKLVDEENDTWEMYTTDDLLPVLKLTCLIAQSAERKLRAPPRGQSALRLWTRSLCDWREAKLRKAVTIDQANPGSSETFRFLEALLEPLDSKAVRYLPTVLRKERIRRRRKN